MKIKFRFIIILISLILVLCYIYFSITKSSEKNLDLKKADISLNANDLVVSYKLNEEKSDILFSGKIIEVTGFIKEITTTNQRITLILKSNDKNYGVICDINPNQIEKIKKLNKSQEIKVKGVCKGFLKDVILHNCFIDLPTNE